MDRTRKEVIAMRLVPRSRIGKLTTIVVVGGVVLQFLRHYNVVVRIEERLLAVPPKLINDPDFLAWMQDPDNNDPVVQKFRAAHPGLDLAMVNQEQLLENHELMRAMGSYVATRAFDKLFKRDRKEQGDPFDGRLEQLSQALLGVKPTPTERFLTWLWDESNTDPDAIAYREKHPHLMGADPEDYPLGIELGNLMVEFTIVTNPQLAWLIEEPELDEILEKAGIRDAMDRSFKAWLWDEDNTNPKVLAFRAAHPDLGPDSPKEAYPPPSEMISVLGAYVRRVTLAEEEPAD